MTDISEALIEHMLSRGAVIRGDISWVRRGGRARFRLEVDNEMGEPMSLEMHLSSKVPWQYTIQLSWRKRAMRRLDIRGSHTNVCDGSGTRWSRQTHKHQFSDNYEMAQAHTPEDIQVSDVANFDSAEYERVFDAFCRECGVGVDVSWVPPPALEQPATLSDLS